MFKLSFFDFFSFVFVVFIDYDVVFVYLKFKNREVLYFRVDALYSQENCPQGRNN